MSVHYLNKRIMKKSIYIIALLFALTSCLDNVYINGDLDGMWQLQKVENVSNTTIEYPCDIYYSFQRNLTFISRMNETDVAVRYLGNLYYNSKEGSVTINGLRKFTDEKQIATTEILRQFMLFDLESVFIIKKMDKKQLIMNCGSYTYYLQRW